MDLMRVGGSGERKVKNVETLEMAYCHETNDTSGCSGMRDSPNSHAAVMIEEANEAGKEETLSGITVPGKNNAYSAMIVQSRIAGRRNPVFGRMPRLLSTKDRELQSYCWCSCRHHNELA